MKRNKIVLFSVIIGVLYLSFGVSDLSYYGVNWDEPVHFGRGHAILHFFLTEKTDYEDIQDSELTRRSYYQHDGYTYDYFEEKFQQGIFPITGAGHPPLSDVIGAIFNIIFYQKFNVLGDIESHHLYAVVVSSLLISFLFYFLSTEYNIFAALVTTLSITLYPLFLGESRFNTKDIPQACFYALTVMFFYIGITSDKIRYIFISSLFFSFSFGTKFNILFLPFTLVLWLIIFYLPKIKSGFKKIIVSKTRIFASFLFYPFFSLTIFFISWPLMWTDSINRFLYNLIYYKTIGTSPIYIEFITFFNISTYALMWIVYTTPLAILFLSIVGILFALKFGWKEKNKTSLLILLWFLVPIIRVTVPGTSIYGGVRQIMEYIPAMAILSGIGAAYIVKLLNGYIGILIKTIWKKQFNNIAIEQWSNRTRVILQLIVIVSFIPITLKIISLHPNESIYFNPIVGGLKGAKEKNIPGWGNSLGSTYRQGTNWFNEHAEKGAKVAFVYELLSNIPYSELRSDIVLYNQTRSGLEQKGEYIIGVTHEGTRERAFHRKYLESFLDPVYAVEVEGVPVLKIWKNDPAHKKSRYKDFKVKRDKMVFKKDRNALIIDLGEAVILTKIQIRYIMENCTSPKNGHFEYSIYGNSWRQTEGGFSAFPLSVLTNPKPKPGLLQFWFPIERARFIKLVINDKDSCLLLHPIDILLYHF